MTQNRLRVILLLVTALVLYRENSQQAFAAAAPRMDWCDEICTLSTLCEEVCYTAVSEGPPFETSCGAFTEYCGNTCDVICSGETTGNTVCIDDSEETTCQDYGVWRHCGDGYCASTESWVTCEDCETPPPVPPSTSSIANAGSAANLCALYGKQCESIPTTTSICSQKQERLQQVAGIINATTTIRDSLDEIYTMMSPEDPLYGAVGTALTMINDIRADALDAYLLIAATPCFTTS